MTPSTRSVIVLLLGSMLSAAAVAAPTGAPASKPLPGATFPYIATVAADSAWVRCGAGFDYYAVGRINIGQIVRVVGEQATFSRVQLTGPAFREFYGYIKYPKISTTRFRLDEGGKGGVTLGWTDVVAPNVQEKNDPAQSWKSLVRLEAETPVTVLETRTTTTETVHKIALPAGAEAWINTSDLRAATAEEQQLWASAVEETSSGVSWVKPSAAAPNESRKPAPAREEKPAAAKESKPAVLGRDEPQAPPVKPPPPAPVSEPPATVESGKPAPVVISTDKGDVEAPASDGTGEGAASRARDQRQAEQIRSVTIEDLDAALTRLRAEDVTTAEIEPLRQRYLDYAQRHSDKKGTVQYATVRAEQLKVWGDGQKQLQAVADARRRAKMSQRDAEAVVRAMNTRGDYVAVGRLDASTIYDGQRLPALYRLKDFSTGRTIGYLQKDEPGFDLTTMLGQTMGIVGESDYDNGLRLNIIKPRRIDLLAPPDEVSLSEPTPAVQLPPRTIQPSAPQLSPQAAPTPAPEPPPPLEPEKP